LGNPNQTKDAKYPLTSSIQRQCGSELTHIPESQDTPKETVQPTVWHPSFAVTLSDSLELKCVEINIGTKKIGIEMVNLQPA